jgi:hypothetical protein
MFVLQGKKTRAELRDQAEVEVVIGRLRSGGLTPVLRSMLEDACESVELPPHKLSITALLADPRFRRRPVGVEATVG